MKLKSVFAGFLSLAMAAVLLAGCANQMEPAKNAIAGIEAAIAAAGPDAAQYIPDQLQAVTSQLNDLKMKFDQKDYKGVLAAAPALLTQAQGLASAAGSAKQAAQAAALEALNRGVGRARGRHSRAAGGRHQPGRDSLEVEEAACRARRGVVRRGEGRYGRSQHAVGPGHGRPGRRKHGAGRHGRAPGEGKSGRGDGRARHDGRLNAATFVVTRRAAFGRPVSFWCVSGVARSTGESSHTRTSNGCRVTTAVSPARQRCEVPVTYAGVARHSRASDCGSSSAAPMSSANRRGWSPGLRSASVACAGAHAAQPVDFAARRVAANPVTVAQHRGVDAGPAGGGGEIVPVLLGQQVGRNVQLLQAGAAREIRAHFILEVVIRGVVEALRLAREDDAVEHQRVEREQRAEADDAAVRVRVAIGDPSLAIAADAGERVVIAAAPDRIGRDQPERRRPRPGRAG